MNELFNQLSDRSFIKISNRFPFLFASWENCAWRLEISHCSHRETEFILEGEFGEKLEILLQKALDKILEIEKIYG